MFYIDAVISHSQSSKVILGGWSLGGVIAYEMSVQLQKRGITVLQLLLIEPDPPSQSNKQIAADADYDAEELNETPDYIIAYLQTLPPNVAEKTFNNLSQDITMAVNYRPSTQVAIPVQMFEAKYWNSHSCLSKNIPLSNWSTFMTALNITAIEADHLTIMDGENLSSIAEAFNQEVTKWIKNQIT